MKQYLQALGSILAAGVDREGRNGWTRAQWAIQMRFDMQHGFPAITTKKLAFEAVKSELLWFLSGSTNDNDLKALVGKEKTIWTANAEDYAAKGKAQYPGDLGRIYGQQWRAWKGYRSNIDQIYEVVQRLRQNPFDRRLVVSAWNVADLEQMALPPCHMIFQFFVAPNPNPRSRRHFLSLHMVQRSCDMFLGVPFNIASYGLLLSMIAHVVGMEPWECVITLNDAHIYHEHFGAVNEQLSRTPLSLPKLWLNPHIKEIGDFMMQDVRLDDYRHLEPIKAKMIV